MYGVLEDQPGKGKAEYGGDVGQGAVGLAFGDLAQGLLFFLGLWAFVMQEFIRIDALELAAGVPVVLLEPLAEHTGQRVTLNVPELCHADAGGVNLECGSH